MTGVGLGGLIARGMEMAATAKRAKVKDGVPSSLMERAESAWAHYELVRKSRTATQKDREEACHAACEAERAISTAKFELGLLLK